MLNIPKNIQTELAGNSYSINPLVVIYLDYEDIFGVDVTQEEPNIYISTIKQSLKITEDSETEEIWEDRNLKITSIKESLNVTTKSFTINNVQISLSNDIINGTRFSDVISGKGILHKKVSIFYQTPSCKTLDECVLVYKGIITEMSHDFKTFKITCEDLTEFKLGNKFPIANVGFGNNIVNVEDKNKPIPVLYGHVDRAPAILLKSNIAECDTEFDTYVLCDDVLTEDRKIDLGGFIGEYDDNFVLTGTNSTCPLFIYKGDYYQVLQSLQEEPLMQGEAGHIDWNEQEDYGSWVDSTQYRIDSDNIISIPTQFSEGFQAMTPPSFGDLQTFIIRKPTDMIIAPHDPANLDGIWTSVTTSQEVSIGNKHGVLDTEALEDSEYTTLAFDPSGSENTYASLPDELLEASDLPISDWNVKTSFKPTRYNDTSNGIYGMWLPKYNPEIIANPLWDAETNTDSYTTGQFQIFQYLMLYAADINAGFDPESGEDPPIEVIAMPSRKQIWKEMNRWMILNSGQYYNLVQDASGNWEALPFSPEEVTIDNMYNLTLWYYKPLLGDNGWQSYNGGYDEEGGIPIGQGLNQIIYYPIDGNVLGDNWVPENFVEALGFGNFENKMNAYPFINNKTWDDYKNTVGFNNDGSSDDLGNYGDLYASEVFNVNQKMMWAEALGAGGQVVDPTFPQGVFFRFQISEHHWKKVWSIGYPSFPSWNNWAHMFVSASQNHDSMLNPLEAGIERAFIGLNYQYVGSTLFHFDIFEEEGSDYVGLFDKNDFGRYIPKENVGRRRFNNEDANEAEELRHTWGAELTWHVYHNGVNNGETPPYLYDDDSSTGTMNPQSYFYKWGQASWHGANDFTSEQISWNNIAETPVPQDSVSTSELFLSATGASIGTTYVIMLNQDIAYNMETTYPSFNEDFQVSGGISYPQLKIPKNTILPLHHESNTISFWDAQWNSEYDSYHWNTGYTCYPTSTGNLFIEDPGSIQVATDTTLVPPSSRLNLIFPIRPVDGIEDDILTKTIFFGKINCFLQDKSGVPGPNGLEQRFRVALNKVEYMDNTTSLKIEHEDMEFHHNLLLSSPLETIPTDGFNQMFSTYGDNQDVSSHTLDGFNHFYAITNQINWIHDEIKTTYQEQEGDFSTSGWNEVDAYNAFCVQFYIYDYNLAEATANFSTQIYEAGLLQFIHFNPSFNSPFYVDAKGRINGADDIITFEDSDLVEEKYTGNSYQDSNQTPIEKPTDIIYHLIEKEFNLIDMMDVDNIVKTRPIHSQDKYAFSINEEITGKDFIKNFSKETKLFPRFKATSLFGFASIKDTYTLSDVDMIIKSKDILSYSFSKTGAQEINTMVNVKYKYDYAKGSFIKQTGYVDGYDMFGNGDGTNGYSEEGVSAPGLPLSGRPDGYSYSILGLEREDKVLEFEAKHIRDKATALRLRNYLYFNSCNSHNLFKLKLPLKYIALETGDVIRFDSLINNMKAYNEDYTRDGTIRNGQGIYPFFLITSVSKRQKDIDITCYQLHNLTKTFTATLGSTTRMVSAFAPENDIIMGVSFEDAILIQQFVDGELKYFTSGQKISADIDVNGIVDENDYYSALDMAGIIPWETDALTGDLNDDGLADVIDVVALVNLLLGTSEDYIDAADINDDGVVNIVDIVYLINLILGGT